MKYNIMSNSIVNDIADVINKLRINNFEFKETLLKNGQPSKDYRLDRQDR